MFLDLVVDIVLYMACVVGFAKRSPEGRKDGALT